MAIDPRHTPLTFKGVTFTADDKDPLCHNGKWQWGIDSDDICYDEDDWHWNVPYFISAYMTGRFTYPYCRIYDTRDEALKDFYSAYRVATCQMPSRFNTA